MKRGKPKLALKHKKDVSLRRRLFEKNVENRRLLCERTHLERKAALQAGSSVLLDDVGLGCLISSGSKGAKTRTSRSSILFLHGSQNVLAEGAHTALHRLVVRGADSGLADVLFSGADIGHRGGGERVARIDATPDLSNWNPGTNSPFGYLPAAEKSQRRP